MTRSRAVLDGAMTSMATTSPFGRRYWRMLSWEISRSSSMRMLRPRVSMTAQSQKARSSTRSTLTVGGPRGTPAEPDAAGSGRPATIGLFNPASG